MEKDKGAQDPATLAAKQRALALASELNDERRQRHMLESELQLALAASRKAEEAHAVEIARVEDKWVKASRDAHALIEKVQTVHEIEDAIREVYVQMKGRSVSASPVAELPKS
jgi:hypothetical protein